MPGVPRPEDHRGAQTPRGISATGLEENIFRDPEMSKIPKRLAVKGSLDEGLRDVFYVGQVLRRKSHAALYLRCLKV